MKKKSLLFVLLLLSTLTASAQTLIDGIYYEFDSYYKQATVISGDTKYSGSVTIPETVTYNGETYSVTAIGNDAFYDCYDLKEVTIPNSVKTIGFGAFSSCDNLASIIIPNSVIEIQDMAFCSCSSLTSITIPNSVTTIGNGAFSDCRDLKEVTIGTGVTEIEGRTFEGCMELTSITIEKGNTKYDSRDNCNAIIETATNTLILGCKNTVIPNSVTAIGDEAFNSFYNLTEVTIPNSVTSIGNSAFKNCSDLTLITIPNSVTSIGEEAFEYCNSLTSINIPSSVTEIGEEAFAGCYDMTSISVEKGNTKYDSRDNCNAIIETATNTLIAGCKNTVIPNDITAIGNYALFGCDDLTSVTIPNSVKRIGEMAIAMCYDMTSVTIGNNVTEIGRNAFYASKRLKSIAIPNSVTSIDRGAFSYSDSLTSVSIGNGVISIGSGAFEDCSSLTEVYCHAKEVPSTESDAFNWVDLSNTTLYVPEASLNAYQTTEPWSGFGSIVALDEPVMTKCATPTITYEDGKLTFSCDTEDAEIHYEYGSKGIGYEVDAPRIITFRVYASKEGYEDSDVATKEIEVGSTAKKGDVNEDGIVNGTDIQEVINIIVEGE